MHSNVNANIRKPLIVALISIISASPRVVY